MPNEVDEGLNKSNQLLQTIASFDSCLVVMHDNPDPDAIASGWAIVSLIHEKADKACRLVGGGAIVRGENRHMVDLLQPPIELVDELDFAGNVATILVDCGLGASNHLLTRGGICPVAVIDHHANGKPDSGSAPFHDLRPDVAASATIAASYMKSQNVEPTAKLATAMFYAIRSETAGYEFHFSDLDREMLPWITKRYDPSLVAEIESAPLSRGYFADLVLAFQSAFLYDDIAICILPRAEGVEIVGEVADLLIRCDGIRCVLCGAAHREDFVISVRTCDDQTNAAKLLQKTLTGLGGGGGHAHRAGGKISGVANNGKLRPEVEAQLTRRWLSACHAKQDCATRLVDRREIMDNL